MWSRMVNAVEEVFRALGDETRRRLLDRLFARDGQALGELAQGLEMTRFGVMKHLRVLEDAGLVITRRQGRRKLHFLNPVPIRLVHDRWISKFAEPWAGAMAGLKHALEEESNRQRTTSTETYIRTTPGELWSALTTPGTFFGSMAPAAHPVASEAPRWLSLRGGNLNGDTGTRIECAIEQHREVCKLTVKHDGDAPWSLALSRLKTLLETGRPLEFDP